MEAKNNKENLCSSCSKLFPTCNENIISFGDGVGNDNVTKCVGFESKAILTDELLESMSLEFIQNNSYESNLAHSHFVVVNNNGNYFVRIYDDINRDNGYCDIKQIEYLHELKELYQAIEGECLS